MGFFLVEVEADLAYIWIQNSLSRSPYTVGLIIPRSQWVSGHVVRASFRLFVWDTSPKCIDREGLGRRLTGTCKTCSALWWRGPKITMKPPLPPGKAWFLPQGHLTLVEAFANRTTLRARLKFRTFYHFSLECWLVWNSVVRKCGREKLKRVQNSNRNTIFILIC